MSEQLIKDFDSRFYQFQEFRDKTESLVSSILRLNGLSIHKIESRIKRRDSLIRKIQIKGAKYTSLSDITDIVGIRVITYFEDEVDQIANLIKEEFDIDPENSVDKRIMESDRFGYQSLHYIFNYHPQRLQLLEYKHFAGIKAEIQIRSILQHAWAEIEHDIGYKNSRSIPDLVKRNFYRIAALLESADLEFVRLRDTIEEYSNTVKEDIKAAPETVLLDQTSLSLYFQTSETLARLDNAIASIINATVVDTGKTVEEYLNILDFFNINTIQELEEYLANYEKEIIGFAKDWIEGENYSTFSKGIAIFYLAYILAAQNRNREFIYSYLEKQHIGSDREKVVNEILETYSRITDN